ncbi:MAG: LAGLIDADG family homing endonuclease, partial [Actinomycetota bacterium]
LEPGDRIVLNDVRGRSWKGQGTHGEGWLIGSLIGDGYVNKSQDTAIVQFWGPHKDHMLNLALERVATLGGDPRYHKMREGGEMADGSVRTQSRQLLGLCREYGISDDKEFLTDAVVTASSDFQGGFLRGFFDADGTVLGTQNKGVSVRLSQSNIQRLVVVQRMLMNFGINSTVYLNRREPGETLLPDGKGGRTFYTTEAQHELVISKDNLRVFYDRIGFDDPGKCQRLEAALDSYVRDPNRERFVATVEAVSYVGVEDVYDCTVEDVHAFGANGVVVHNCGEMALEDAELCNLIETFPSRHASYEEFERTLKFAYLYAKTVTLVPTHDERTNAVMMRNRRIGTSMSGIVQAMKRHGRRNFFGWCDRGYAYLRKLDDTYSRWLCIPKSIKLSTTKPSGTVSLLPGVTPGIHFPHTEYYYRVIRFRSNSPLVAKLREAGYRCIDLHPPEPDNTAVYFAVHEEHFDRAKKDVTMWEQLEIAAAIQQYWSDNAVSITVTFQPHEAKDVRHALELFESRLKSVSFLPLKEHGYTHAPYQEIDREMFESYVAGLQPLVLEESTNERLDAYCDSDRCEVPNGNGKSNGKSNGANRNGDH